MSINIKCPCEECISLAICYQTNELSCSELYHSICKVDQNNMFEGHKKLQVLATNSIFGRYIACTSHVEHRISMSTCDPGERRFTFDT